MSLVGPRPPLPSEVETYAHDVRRRLLVKPGMTGLRQINGRSDLSWDESVRFDLYYVELAYPFNRSRAVRRLARAPNGGERSTVAVSGRRKARWRLGACGAL